MRRVAWGWGWGRGWGWGGHGCGGFEVKVDLGCGWGGLGRGCVGGVGFEGKEGVFVGGWVWGVWRSGEQAVTIEECFAAGELVADEEVDPAALSVTRRVRCSDKCGLSSWENHIKDLYHVKGAS